MIHKTGPYETPVIDRQTGKTVVVAQLVDSNRDPEKFVVLVLEMRPDGQESVKYGKVFCR